MDLFTYGKLTSQRLGCSTLNSFRPPGVHGPEESRAHHNRGKKQVAFVLKNVTACAQIHIHERHMHTHNTHAHTQTHIHINRCIVHTCTVANDICSQNNDFTQSTIIKYTSHNYNPPSDATTQRNAQSNKSTRNKSNAPNHA